MRTDQPETTMTPGVDLRSVVNRIANCGSVEDYTVESIRETLRDALMSAAKSGSAGTADAERIVQAEIASSTGPTGGWLDSPKAVCASIVQKLRESAPSEEWVSVEERLPDKQVMVLLSNPRWPAGSPVMMMGHIDGLGEWCGHFTDTNHCGWRTNQPWRLADPTHWRPLPPAPEKAR